MLSLAGHPRAILLTLFIGALVLRLAYAGVALQIDPLLNGDPLLGDAASYDRIARSLAAGTGYSEAPPEPTAFWPPLYPFFLAAIYWVAGHQLMLARMVNSLLGAFVPIVIFLIGTRLFDRRVALLAAIGSAVYPLFVVLGAWVIPDGPFVLMVCLILLLMLEMQRAPSITRSVALGVLLGMAFLLKPVTAFFLPLLIPWFMLAVPGRVFRSRFVAGVITASVLVLMLAPWTIRNQLVMGSMIVGSSNGGYTFYGANNPDAFGGHYEHFPARMHEISEGEEQREFYRLGLQWIRSEPRAFLALEVKKFARLISPLSIASNPEDLSVPGERFVRFGYAVFLLLAVSGYVMLLRSWRSTGFLAIPVLAVLVSTAVFYGDARYTMPMVPTLLLWSSVALVIGFDAIRSLVPRWRAEGNAPVSETVIAPTATQPER